MQRQGIIAQLTLRDGTLIHFRHVCPEDEPLISDAFRSSSRDTLLHRFFTPIRELAPDQLRRMLTIDPERETCIVGMIETSNGPRIICGIRFVRLPNTAGAEIALTIHDDFQRKGIGTFLLQLITRLAREAGIRSFEADVMTSNTGMLRLIRKQFPSRREQLASGDVIHIHVDLGA